MSGPAPVTADVPPASGSAYPPKAWPSSPARYWALFAITFATKNGDTRRSRLSR